MRVDKPSYLYAGAICTAIAIMACVLVDALLPRMTAPLASNYDAAH